MDNELNRNMDPNLQAPPNNETPKKSFNAFALLKVRIFEIGFAAVGLF